MKTALAMFALVPLFVSLGNAENRFGGAPTAEQIRDAINEGVEFKLNDTVVPMKPGECWYLRLSDPHEVTNAGSTERINMPGTPSVREFPPTAPTTPLAFVVSTVLRRRNIAVGRTVTEALGICRDHLRTIAIDCVFSLATF